MCEDMKNNWGFVEFDATILSDGMLELTWGVQRPEGFRE